MIDLITKELEKETKNASYHAVKIEKVDEIVIANGFTVEFLETVIKNIYAASDRIKDVESKCISIFNKIGYPQAKYSRELPKIILINCLLENLLMMKI